MQLSDCLWRRGFHWIGHGYNSSSLIINRDQHHGFSIAAQRPYPLGPRIERNPQIYEE